MMNPDRSSGDARVWDAGADNGVVEPVTHRSVTTVLIPLVAGVLAFLGVGVLLYPQAASWVSQYNQSRVVSDAVVDGSSESSEDGIQLARAHDYNSRLATGSAVYDAGSNGPVGSDASSLHGLYLRALAGKGGVMGRIQIPSINVDLPVYHGTDDATLLQGIGHLEGTALPVGGKGTHAVLTGHRGLANATMFTNLNKVVKGDEFTISTYGKVLTYRVTDISVVDPDQTRSLLPVANRDLVTLVTCTPLGINSQRIFVTGVRVLPTPDDAVSAASSTPSVPGCPWWAFALVSFLAIDIAYMRIAVGGTTPVRHRRSDDSR